jgi:NAD(P)H-hydrate epimerase
MKAIEVEANATGLTNEQLMENAGYHLANEIMELLPGNEEGEDVQILGLVGPGNNGGDTLIALARLAEKGWTVRAYMLKRSSDNAALISRLSESNGEVIYAEDDERGLQLQAFVETAEILLDGVLGTGFQFPIKAEIGKILSSVKTILGSLENPPAVIAVDCPSGTNCDTGQVSEETIPADITITMAAVKRGLLILPAFSYAGVIRIGQIGDLSDLAAWKGIMNEVADDQLISNILPDRPLDAHKGTFGTAMITSGSINYTGAALLAGKAAARIGAGLVTMSIPAPLHPALAGHFPEATWILLPHEMGVIAASAAEVLMKNIDRATAMLIGPGMGLEDTTREFMVKLLGSKSTPRINSKRIGFIKEEGIVGESSAGKDYPPMVIDADGLKLLARIDSWQQLLAASTILTPHPGEMAILTGQPLNDIQADRLGIAKKCAIEWGHVIVLKGAFTVIAAPDGRTTTIPFATPALSHAGTGDVLSGLITGLRAQGVGAYESAVAGAWIHARAGSIASMLLGHDAVVLAGDVLDCVPDVLQEL